MSAETIFNIASLTKVTSTLGCIMQLVDDGRLATTDLVSSYILEFSSHGKEAITVSNLLLHNAGLAPDVPPKFIASKQMAMRWIYDC